MDKPFFEKYPWVALVLILLAFGIVGHMDFMDEVRTEYQNKCIGEIDVQGSLVICTAPNSSTHVVIGELK